MAKKIIIVKKLPAVRLAIKELGVEATVAEVRRWVKEKYGHDLTDAVAQNYVSIGRRETREENGTPKKRKYRRKVTSMPSLAPVAVTPKPSGNGLAIGQVVEAVATLKGLVGTLGKDNLLKLVEAI
jgi:hypothetical protein